MRFIIWWLGGLGDRRPNIKPCEPGRLATKVHTCILWYALYQYFKKDTCILPTECDISLAPGRKFVLLTREWRALWEKQTMSLHSPRQPHLESKRSTHPRRGWRDGKVCTGNSLAKPARCFSQHLDDRLPWGLRHSGYIITKFKMQHFGQNCQISCLPILSGIQKAWNMSGRTVHGWGGHHATWGHLDLACQKVLLIAFNNCISACMLKVN